MKNARVLACGAAAVGGGCFVLFVAASWAAQAALLTGCEASSSAGDDVMVVSSVAKGMKKARRTLWMTTSLHRPAEQRGSRAFLA